MSSRGRRIRKPSRRHFPPGEQIIHFCFSALAKKKKKNVLEALCFCRGIRKCYMNIQKNRVALELQYYKYSIAVRNWEFRRWLWQSFRSLQTVLGSLYRRQWLRGWMLDNKSTEEDDRGDRSRGTTWGLPWRDLQCRRWWRGYWKDRQQRLRACRWSRLDQRRREQTNGFRVYEQQVRVQALQLCDAQMWGEMFLSAGVSAQSTRHISVFPAASQHVDSTLWCGFLLTLYFMLYALLNFYLAFSSFLLVWAFLVVVLGSDH